MPLPVLSTMGAYNLSALANSAASGGGAGAWQSANRAIYVPFVLEEEYLVKQLWWANGGTAAGNLDCGIYDATGTRLFSTGSTAQSGTTIIQAVDIADQILAAGTYYMALAASSTSTTVIRGNSLYTSYQMLGYAQQASAFPLPSTATFATSTGDLPFFGITNRTLI